MATKNLAATITIGGTLTSGLKGALGSTKTALRDIGSEIIKLQRANKAIGSDIRTFDRLGRNVEGLRQTYANTVREVDRLRLAQRRLTDAQSRSDRVQQITGFHNSPVTMKGAGVGATVAGGAIIGSMVPGVNEAKHFQTEQSRIKSLGLGDDVSKEAISYAKDLKTYGTSMLDNLQLTRDALSIFTTMHDTRNVVPTLAKMKFGNAAMFGAHGAENEAAFIDMLKVVELRGGAHSKEEFEKQADLIQKVVSATGGRVGASEWRNVIARGGIAAKLTRDDAFYYQLEPLVQMQGGDQVGTGLSAAYSSLYQGRTTKRAANNLEKYGLVAPGRKIKHDKAGQISFLNPGDLLGSDIFRESQYEWVKKVLLPALAKKGVTEDKEIADAIASFVSNRKGADLLATMVLQRSLIDKDEAKNRGAYGVSDMESESRATAAGKEIKAHKDFEDAQLSLGNNVLPLYTRALVAASDALVTFNKFTEANPGLSSAVVIGVTSIGAGLVVLGPLLVAAGGFLNLYAAAQLRVAAAATAAATATTAETTAIVTQNAAAGGGALGKFGKFAGGALAAVAVANVADYAAGKIGLGGKSINEEQDSKNWDRFNWWQKGESGVGRGIESAIGFIGLSNLENQARSKRIATETSYLDGKEIPPMRGAGEQTSPVIQQENNFNITQLPGESGDDLARKIAKQMAAQNAIKQRSALTDGASTQ